MNHESKIVVITPVRNGDWILDKYLFATSLWANKIIIGLDKCTDNSRAICEKYDKVEIVEINSLDTNIKLQNNRRQILLETARKICKNNIIIALDVDEIFSAEILDSDIMSKIKCLKTGEVLNVKFRELWFSPYLYRSEKRSNWSNRLMPCIWKDDGTDYPVSDWHEARCPLKGKQIIDLNLLHFARVVPLLYYSRIRHYILRDAIENNHNVWITNYIYSSVRNEKNMRLSAVPIDWYAPYIQKDINFFVFKDSLNNWYNHEIINILRENIYNENIYKCDIWDVNWDSIPDILELPKLKFDEKKINKYKIIRNYIRKNYKLPSYRIEFYRLILSRFFYLLRNYMRK